MLVAEPGLAVEVREVPSDGGVGIEDVSIASEAHRASAL